MEQRAVDLVLMDCHMPEMDGLATTRHWRGKEARLQRPRVPVIASNPESDVSVTEYVDAFEGAWRSNSFERFLEHAVRNALAPD